MPLCKIIQIPRISDPRGNLSFIEAGNHIPFNIERSFCIFGVPGGESRGGHAYKTQSELIVPLSGSFCVRVAQQQSQGFIKFHLFKPYEGLLIPPMVWRIMEDFSTNSLSLHLCDKEFDHTDYIYNLEDLEEYGR